MPRVEPSAEFEAHRFQPRLLLFLVFFAVKRGKRETRHRLTDMRVERWVHI
jgi:hypothetical protein